ncbi:hypothetical protein HYFRA_00005437 [Hymenoscyphus fraxineus]|uniref:Uncharacterized protein n=1 Tax=Hymenoscyphus fraxineus TaxID=746836 RepID=A0A9N9PRN1_9HELO|nr:hypothetical protein HYFRA_00005437 [Hymenoscyphus fraxineus]
MKQFCLADFRIVALLVMMTTYNRAGRNSFISNRDVSLQNGTYDSSSQSNKMFTPEERFYRGINLLEWQKTDCSILTGLQDNLKVELPSSDSKCYYMNYCRSCEVATSSSGDRPTTSEFVSRAFFDTIKISEIGTPESHIIHPFNLADVWTKAAVEIPMNSSMDYQSFRSQFLDLDKTNYRGAIRSPLTLSDLYSNCPSTLDKNTPPMTRIDGSVVQKGDRDYEVLVEAENHRHFRCNPFLVLPDTHEKFDGNGWKNCEMRLQFRIIGMPDPPYALQYDPGFVPTTILQQSLNTNAPTKIATPQATVAPGMAKITSYTPGQISPQPTSLPKVSVHTEESPPIVNGPPANIGTGKEPNIDHHVSAVSVAIIGTDVISAFPHGELVSETGVAFIPPDHSTLLSGNILTMADADGSGKSVVFSAGSDLGAESGKLVISTIGGSTAATISVSALKNGVLGGPVPRVTSKQTRENEAYLASLINGMINAGSRSSVIGRLSSERPPSIENSGGSENASPPMKSVAVKFSANTFLGGCVIAFGVIFSG